MAIKVNGVTVASTVIGKQGPLGPLGEPGIQGEPGPAGKSAYLAAVDGGYIGDESTFNKKLAEDNLTQEELNQVLLGYIKNTGGTITGDLNIDGNLTLNGKPIGGSNSPVVMGTYVGNSSVYNTGFQEINLGFKPISLVIIKDYSSERGVIIPLEYKMTIKSFGDNYEQINNIASITSVGGGLIKAYGNSDGGSSTNPPDDLLVLQLTATGFKVANVAGYWKDTSSDIYLDTECMLNDKDVVYTYIALKGE